MGEIGRDKALTKEVSVGCRTLLLSPGGFGLGVMSPQPLPCGDRKGQAVP